MTGTKKLIHEIELNDLWTDQLELKRNEFISKKGTINTNLYFIIEGSLRLFVTTETEEQTIRFGYSNNFIVALDSFITDKPTDYYIVTLKKSKVKVISKKFLLI